MTQLFNRYEEVHLIFDRYDVEKSLKTETRSRRLDSKQTIAYHITNSTRIENVPIKVLLSISVTKDELSTYFTVNPIEDVKDTDNSYVIAYRNNVISTTELHQHHASNQEETDTKIILHAADPYSGGVLQKLIFIQLTRRFLFCAFFHSDSLPEDTIFVTGSKQRKRKIALTVIRKNLGYLKTRALIGLHVLPGADTSITGSMSGKGKISCLHAVSNARSSIHEAFGSLGSVPLADTVKDPLEEYVCMLYQPGTNISQLNELRWCTFVESKLNQTSSHRQTLPFLKVSNDHSISIPYGNPPLYLISTCHR